MGLRRRWRGNAGTASWLDQGIGQPVRLYAYQELTYTAYGKAEEVKGKQKKNQQPSALALKRNRSQEEKSITSISAGLIREGEDGRGNRTQETRDRKVRRQGS